MLLVSARMPARKKEQHRIGRIGWLRAAVLGANDGILSTASLVLGVAASHATHGNVIVAGVAGLVGGAMSMAAGEYVSVHSQADTEQADLAQERQELKTDDAGEHQELAGVVSLEFLAFLCQVGLLGVRLGVDRYVLAGGHRHRSAHQTRHSRHYYIAVSRMRSRD